MKILIMLISLLMPLTAFGATTVKDWTEWGESSRIQYFHGFLGAVLPQLSICNNSGNHLINSRYQGISEKEATARLHRHLLFLVETNATIDLSSNLHAAVSLALFTPIPEEERKFIPMITLEQHPYSLKISDQLNLPLIETPLPGNGLTD